MEHATETTARRTEEWCHWHRGPSETAVLVDSIERQSGSAYDRYACKPCREQRGLTPLADLGDPYPEQLAHLRNCAVCAPGLTRCPTGERLQQLVRGWRKAVSA